MFNIYILKIHTYPPPPRGFKILHFPLTTTSFLSLCACLRLSLDKSAIRIHGEVAGEILRSNIQFANDYPRWKHAERHDALDKPAASIYHRWIGDSFN